jgi:hypothetical protein
MGKFTKKTHKRRNHTSKTRRIKIHKKGRRHRGTRRTHRRRKSYRGGEWSLSSLFSSTPTTTPTEKKETPPPPPTTPPAPVPAPQSTQ